MMGMTWPSAFPRMDPLARLLIDGRPFLIVGIAKTIGTASVNRKTILPTFHPNLFKMYGTQQAIWLNIQARGPEWMEQPRTKHGP